MVYIYLYIISYYLYIIIYTSIDDVKIIHDYSSLDLSFTLDLLSLADQYLLAKLKRMCEDATQNSICIDNVCQTLNIADKRGIYIYIYILFRFNFLICFTLDASALRKLCIEFILKYFGKVIGLSSFLSLPQEILQEVYITAINILLTYLYLWQ